MKILFALVCFAILAAFGFINYCWTKSSASDLVEDLKRSIEQ